MRKHEPEHDEGSELWLMSLADLMSLIMVFFIMLYSMSSIDTKKMEEMSSSFTSRFVKKDEKIEDASSVQNVEAQQKKAFQMLVFMLNLNEDGDALEKIEEMYEKKKDVSKVSNSLQDTVKKLQSMKSKVREGDKKGDDILFELIIQNNDFFDENNKVKQSSLKDISEFIASSKKFIKKIEFEVQSFTSSANPDKKYNFKNNWELSTDRAIKIAKVISDLGIDGDKIAVKGMGSRSPLMPEFKNNGVAILENMKKNDRTHIILKKIKNEKAEF